MFQIHRKITLSRAVKVLFISGILAAGAAARPTVAAVPARRMDPP